MNKQPSISKSENKIQRYNDTHKELQEEKDKNSHNMQRFVLYNATPPLPNQCVKLRTKLSQ